MTWYSTWSLLIHVFSAHTTQNNHLDTPDRLRDEVEQVAALEGCLEASREGADLEEVLEIAEEGGATEREVRLLKALLIQEALAEADAEGGCAMPPGDLEEVTRDLAPLEAVQAAREMGASKEQVLTLAKQKGLDRESLEMLDKALGAAGGGGEGPGADEEGLDESEMEELLDGSSGMSPLQVANLALSEGASTEQALQAAALRGATGRELHKIEEALAAGKHRNGRQAAVSSKRELQEVALAALVDASGDELTAAEMSSLESRTLGLTPTQVADEALGQGASARQAMDLAKKAGASERDIQEMLQTIVQERGQSEGSAMEEGLSGDGEEVARRLKNLSRTTGPEAVVRVDMTELERDIEGKGGHEVAKMALKMGASPKEALQLAKKAGASGEELEMVMEAIVEEGGTSPPLGSAEMSRLERMTEGKGASEAAAVALARGASPMQIVALAKKAGATEEEIQDIVEGVMEQEASSRQMIEAMRKLGAREQDIQNVAQAVFSEKPPANEDDLGADTKGLSAKEITRQALSLGATPKEALTLARKAGASDQEIIAIAQSLAQDDAGSQKLSSASMADLERKAKSMEAAEVVEMALKQGASPKQVLTLARKSGASAGELKSIAQAVLAKDLSQQDANSVPEAMAPAHVAEKALSLGASPAQALALAKKAGASKQEMEILGQSAMMSSGTTGLNVEEMRSLESKSQEMTATEIAEAALSKGASARQVLKLAKASKQATKQELQDVVEFLSLRAPHQVEVGGEDAGDGGAPELRSGRLGQDVQGREGKSGRGGKKELLILKALESELEDDVVNLALNMAAQGFDDDGDDVGDKDEMGELEGAEGELEKRAFGFENVHGTAGPPSKRGLGARSTGAARKTPGKKRKGTTTMSTPCQYRLKAKLTQCTLLHVAPMLTSTACHVQKPDHRYTTFILGTCSTALLQPHLHIMYYAQLLAHTYILAHTYVLTLTRHYYIARCCVMPVINFMLIFFGMNDIPISTTCIIILVQELTHLSYWTTPTK